MEVESFSDDLRQLLCVCVSAQLCAVFVTHCNIQPQVPCLFHLFNITVKGFGDVVTYTILDLLLT